MNVYGNGSVRSAVAKKCKDNSRPYSQSELAMLNGRLIGMPIGREDSHTIAFLRMAAAQLYELAQTAPEIAAELRRVSEQLEAEAAEIDSRAGRGFS
jgi:hypothetical protein